MLSAVNGRVNEKAVGESAIPILGLKLARGEWDLVRVPILMSWLVGFQSTHGFRGCGKRVFLLTRGCSHDSVEGALPQCRIACEKMAESTARRLDGARFQSLPCVVFKGLRHGWKPCPFKTFQCRKFFCKL
jgi:hypothetical protein